MAVISNLKADDEVKPKTFADTGAEALALASGVAAKIDINMVFKNPLRVIKLNGLLIFSDKPRFDLRHLHQ